MGLALLGNGGVVEASFCKDPHYKGLPEADHLRYYGYYRDEGLYEEIRGHANLTIMGPGRAEDARETLLQLRELPSRGRMRVMLDVQSVFFTSEGLREDWAAKWDKYSHAIAPYVTPGVIAAFYTYDEPADRAPVRFYRDLDMVADIIHATFPGIPVAMGFGWWNVHPNNIGQIRLYNYDWYGFNCYGPFENCMQSGASVDQMVQRLKELIGPDKKILLDPEASTFYNYAFDEPVDENALIARARQYYDLAKREKQVIGFIPFLWHDSSQKFYGLKDMPRLKPVFQEMGRKITREIPEGANQSRVCPVYPAP